MGLRYGFKVNRQMFLWIRMGGVFTAQEKSCEFLKLANQYDSKQCEVA